MKTQLLKWLNSQKIHTDSPQTLPNNKLFRLDCSSVISASLYHKGTNLFNPKICLLLM